MKLGKERAVYLHQECKRCNSEGCTTQTVNKGERRYILSTGTGRHEQRAITAVKDAQTMPTEEVCARGSGK
eukprot:scaffold3850_cov101-Skeletonema_dohrnii-CCMP3373.AAC.2